MASVFTSRALETVMPYFSLQAGIALCDMDSHNGATATIPYRCIVSGSLAGLQSNIIYD